MLNNKKAEEMSIQSERRSVQNPLVKYAIEAGWEYVEPNEALRLRRGETNPIFFEFFQLNCSG